MKEMCLGREREVKNEIRFALSLYKEIATRWIEVSVEICRALNLNKNEFVDSKNTLIDRESISQTKSSEIWLDGLKKLLRFYRGETQKSRWIKIPLRSIEKRRKKGLIEENLLRICREAIKLEENEFFKGRKTHKDEYNKKATRPKIQ